MKTDEEISRPAIVADDDEEEDPELCAKEKFILRSFVLEFKFLEDLVEEAVRNGGIVELATVKKAQAILDKYQEQGQLLEPHLESLISPLMGVVREKTSEMGEEVLEVIKPICMFLYGLVTVCGYKTVTRFFPHHVSDLEPAVMLLRRCHADLRSTASTAVRQESTGEWETKCIVILWLSILVLVPFDMSSVDTALALTDDHADTATPPLVQIMISICQHYLSNPGPMRKMSGVLLSRLLTRPDMKPTLTRFMQWTHDMLVAPEDGIANEFLIPGIAEAMAAIFKVGGRDVLLNVASVAWLDTCALARSTFATRSPLLRKLIVKLTQRVGLTYLPPRANSWRYVGQSSFLRQNLISTSKSNSNIEQDLESTIDNANKYLDDEEIDVPDIIEEVIEQLLTGLKDKDTVVRWSAAKGIGRVTNRLTSSLADEVLGSTLDLFSPGEGDGSWHGGCLALAELSRRGLLLPVRLPEVVPVIIKALHYDVRRGPHSIGSHVRDAAAYVCWAFARAYSHSVMKSILNEVAPHLLMIACYDREVNCRRAAAAAFQENVGRQGTFPNGISIVNAADYFSLATRNNSYLNVAVYIAQYNNYLHFFIEELLQSKIQHWEKSLRELSAVALAHLVKYNSLYFEKIVLEKLIPGTLSADLNLRHGSTLAVAEVVLALHQHGHELPSEKQKAVANIVPAIEKARLYRGKGGEIMRVSVSRLIECTSTAKIKLPPKVQKTLLDTLNENLRHPNAQIQACAVEALKQYTQVYINPAEASFVSGLTSKYIETLRSDPNVAAKRGAALALSVLPYEIVVQNWKTILTSLCCACLIPENPDERDAETRVNSVRGLKAICHTLVKGAKESNEPIIINRHNVLKFMKDEVMNCLFTALDDYSVDNRGDVGSWVREAAMEALEQCTFLFFQVFSNTKEQGEETALSLLKDNLSEQVQKDEEFIDKAVVGQLIGLVAKQAVEKIDKVRQIAGRTLQRIIHNEDIFVPFIPHRYELERIIPKGSSINWASSSASFSCLVHLLQLPEYRQFIMSGLVISIGGLAESVSKTSLNALLDYLHAPNNETEIDKEKVKILSSQLCEVLQCYRKKDRVIVPTIKTIELLFDKGIFFNLEEQEEDFSSRIVESLAVELKGSKDVTKLISGINILEHVCAMQKNNHTRTLSLLLSFLCHPYPKVRKACADQVYIFFLQCGEGVFDTIILNQLVDIVGETCWDHHKEEATSQMKKLYSLLKLDSPFVKASIKSAQRLPECKVSKRDENESYSSLVDSSGF